MPEVGYYPVGEGSPIASVPKRAKGKDGLTLLANQIRQEIDSGERQRKTRLKKFDRLLQFYLDQPPDPTNEAFPGASRAHKNIIQVKVDALGTNVARTLTSQEPYCVASVVDASAIVEEGDELQVNLEKMVGFFVKKGRLRDFLSAVSVEAGLYNTGVIKTKWSTVGSKIDPTPGPVFKMVEAHNLSVFPATVYDIWDAKTVADRYWLRRAQVTEAQRKGVFAKTKALSEVSEEGSARAENQPSVLGHIFGDSAGSEENDRMELWDVTFRDFDEAGDEVWWNGILAKKDGVWLRLDKLRYSRPEYHVFRYKSMVGEFWSKSSVANDLQGEQISAMNLQRSLEDGIQFNIYGAVFTTSSGLGEQYSKYGPGDIIEGEFGSEFNILNPKADLGYIPTAIDGALGYADQIARISAPGTGGESTADTATEATIIRAGQQAGVDDYLGTFSIGLVSLWEMVHEYLDIHKGEWYSKLGVFLGVTEQDVKALTAPTMWEPNTSSVGSTPGNQLQVVQMLNEALQMGYPLSKTELTKKMLWIASRLGLSGADKLFAGTPEAILDELSKATGIDPTLLAKAVETAQQQQQVIQEGQTRAEDATIGNDLLAGMGVTGEQPGMARPVPGA